MNAGAVPVVIADGSVNPFSTFFDWDLIAIQYPVKEIYNLISFLQDLVDNHQKKYEAYRDNILKYRTGDPT